MSNDYQNIEQRLKEIIADFKSGKNVTEDLKEFDSEENYEFYEWCCDRDWVDGMHWCFDYSYFPIYEGEDPYDYFTEEELREEDIEKKFEIMFKHIKPNDSTGSGFYFEFIDDVCLLIEVEMMGTGMRFSGVKIANTTEEYRKDYFDEDTLILGFASSEISTGEKELAIWDSFAAKALQKEKQSNG